MKKSGLPPLVDKNTKVLVLGSMPGDRSLQLQQYYSNPSNQFWRIIASLIKVNEMPHAYPERVTILLGHGIGLWDVLRECQREGSSDASIRDEQPNDFAALFHEFPQVLCVAFNGGKARRSWNSAELIAPSGVELVDLPSSSGAPGRHVKPLDQKVKSWKRIANYLLRAIQS